MRQVVRRGLREIIVDTVPDPTVTSHHAVVRTQHSLISAGTETASIHKGNVLNSVAENPSQLRTVWNAMQSAGPTRTIDEVRAKFQDYAVLGYAGAGVIVDVHPTVTDLRIGDRVAYGGEGTGHGEAIMTGRNLIARVPENVSTEHACFATLGSIALHAVRNAEIALGDFVAVIGLGLVGQLVAQLARAQGAQVIAVDLDPARVALARDLGAPTAILGGDGALEAINALTNGRGVDCTIIAAAAKSPAPAQQALAMTRERGRVVVVGAVELQFPYYDMFRKELVVRMSRAYGPGSYDPSYERGGQDYPYPYVRWTENRNMEEFLRRVSIGDVRIAPLISHRFALESAPEAYATVMNPAVRSLAVILEYPAIVTPDLPLTERTIRLASPAASGGASLRFALVGAGNIARWAHLPALRNESRASLRAIVSANGAKATALGKRFGATVISTNLADSLRDEAIDAVLICSRNQAHAGQIIQSLESGKHVLVEKPMAVSAEECRHVLDAQTRSGKMVGVAFNRRFAPMYGKLKASLKGRSGPAVVNATMNSPYMTAGSWMTDPAAGGAVVGEATHMTDLIAWLLDAAPVRVSAQCLPLGKAEPAGESNIVASVGFSDGSIASITYCAVGNPKGGGERVEVFATGRSAWSENFKRFGAPRQKTASKFFPDKGYDAQFTAFVDLVQGKPSAIATARDGAIATLTCLAILESARAGGCSVLIDTDELSIARA